MKDERLVDATIKSLTENLHRVKTKKVENVVTNLKTDERDNYWITGTITIDNKIYDVNAKVFLEGSKFGIDDGPVSKLHIQDTGTKKTIINYDRGWDIEPANDEQKKVYNIVLDEVTKFRTNNPYSLDESVEEHCDESDKVEEIKELKTEETSALDNEAIAKF